MKSFPAIQDLDPLFWGSAIMKRFRAGPVFFKWFLSQVPRSQTKKRAHFSAPPPTPPPDCLGPFFYSGSRLLRGGGGVTY